MADLAVLGSKKLVLQRVLQVGFLKTFLENPGAKLQKETKTIYTERL